MRNNRNHSLNRFLLLGILFVSAIIPFLNIQFFYEEVPLKQVEVFHEFVTAPIFTETTPPESVHSEMVKTGLLINWWLLVYLSVIVLMLIRIVVGIFKVTQIIKRAEKRRLHKIVLALVKDLIQPFTFLNKVVLSEKDFTENKAIIVAHEHAHIKQLHSIDLMVCEVFTVLHFFNPFMWLLRRDLKLIHEYQADQAVLNKGIDAKKYQLLVLQKSVGERRFAMANHFTQKPILKRLKMMQKKNRKKWAALKLMLFLPLLVILLQAFARPELITKTEDFIPVKYTENKAEKWLLKWTADNIGKGFYEPDLIEKDAPRKPNNVLVILMNAKNEYLIEDEHHPEADIKKVVKDYLHGINPDGKNGPDYVEKEIPEIGKMKVSKGMISYKHDINSSNEMVNKTIREIGEACIEVRDEKAKVLFNKSYLDLDEEKQLSVNKAVPVWFSNEYPKAPPASVWLPFDNKPSDDPKPMELLVRHDGTMYLGNIKYNNLDEFKENLQAWKKELEESEKDSKTKPYYRVNLTCEQGSETEQICSDEIGKIEYVLWKENMHIERISHIFYQEDVIRPLETDKIKARVQRVKGEVEAEQIVYQDENKGLDIEIRKDAIYIDDERYSLEEAVEKAKAWQKIGSEDIFLIPEVGVSQKRVDEVTAALSRANIYHANKKHPGSNEIIYRAGDVSVEAQFTQGIWSDWLDEKMKYLADGKPDGWGYQLTISFVIDKKGKVKEGRIIKECEYAEVNQAMKKVLAEVPDWKPAQKGTEKVNVLYKGMYGSER
jgi:beta-lactamase regulating signal transducer with metallopeptidase domain/biopolymer transport protein ExbD